jgi:hypothetical protein
MLTGIHFLLSYMCNSQCDHCFLYCHPFAKGTFSMGQIKMVLEEAVKIGTVEWIYYEGGEPLLFYPILIEGIKMAYNMGFKTGVVTNGYMATSDENAEIWLKGLFESGLTHISISNDAFHYDQTGETPAQRASAIANRLGLSESSICIEKPEILTSGEDNNKGAPVIGGNALFKGRAAEKLTEGLPRKPWDTMTTCPHEELVHPHRVHVDSYGNVHICQGISMGNFLEIPFSKIINRYDAASHPICGPLVEGGPARLAKAYNIKHEDTYVEECHFCYLTRLSLVNQNKFPEYLTPKLVYGFNGGN